MLTAAMSERDDFFDGDFAWNDETLDTIAGPTPVTARDRVARAAQRVTGPRRMRFPDRRGLLRLGVLVFALAVVGIVLGVSLSGGGSEPVAAPPPPPALTQPQPRPQTTATPRPATPAVVVPTTTILRPGDKGPAVRALQRALKQLGLLTAAVDGDFGPATQAAVVEFQHRQMLPDDALVGPQTARALNRAVVHS